MVVPAVTGVPAAMAALPAFRRQEARAAKEGTAVRGPVNNRMVATAARVALEAERPSTCRAHWAACTATAAMAAVAEMVVEQVTEDVAVRPEPVATAVMRAC